MKTLLQINSSARTERSHTRYLTNRFVNTTVPFSTTLYRRRHRIENFFERIKRYRRVATRYDKLAETFLEFICLAILFTLHLT
jgi:transposase